MTERLLQFIWQFQYFNKSELTTTNGEIIQVIFAGHYNTNQGPDFSDAMIRIGSTTWAGTVELHLRTSDWIKHNHQHDKNYTNVILHVVWEDVPIPANLVAFEPTVAHMPGSPLAHMPVLQLHDRVSKLLLHRYEELINSFSFIPCQNMITSVPDITWKLWKERLLAERLLRKAKVIDTILQQNHFHWEETFWWMIARNFGIKINADAFEQVARSIPLMVLSRHKNQVLQLESLLLGQAGLLEGNFNDAYPRMLQNEYQFLKNKYKLRHVPVPVYFLRMRPGNFPTIRLAQLAMLIHDAVHLFSRIKDAASVNEVKEWMDVTANDYWHYHYRFDDAADFKKKRLGSITIENIIINTVSPMLFAYGDHSGDNKYKDRALQWLEEISPESNSITKGFCHLGLTNKSAYDSQSLIELKNEYCDKKRCLDCSVGYSILKMDNNKL